MNAPVTSTTTQPRPYEIWGNWKMNPPTLEEAEKLLAEIAYAYADLNHEKTQKDSDSVFTDSDDLELPFPTLQEDIAALEEFDREPQRMEAAQIRLDALGICSVRPIGVGLFIPHAYITELGRHPAMKVGWSAHKCLQLGAQNMYYHDTGAFTGEHSPLMVKSLFEYLGQTPTVLIGHSERRDLFGESDQLINKKMLAAYRHGIRPFLAIGEQITDRETGKTGKVLEAQLRKALAGISAEQFVGARTVIAYEPVWAIGTGKTATPEIANETHAFIRGVLDGMYGREAAHQTTIQYGGSMKPENAAALMAMPHIDGGLIGGASLSTAQFIGIVRAVPKLA